MTKLLLGYLHSKMYLLLSHKINCLKKKIGLKNLAKKSLTNCSKKQRPFEKKKKPNKNSKLNVPTVTSAEERNL